MHKSNLTRVLNFTRTMDSKDQFAQRIEESAESGRSRGASHAQNEQTRTPGSVIRTQGQERKSRSKDVKELRQLGAIDFSGTIDPAEAEAWLKRTERIFTLMGSTEEDQLALIVSLLQGDT